MVFQTQVFEDFLNRCSETSKSVAITHALNEVMADQKLDLTFYDGYDTESIGCTDDDLMRAVCDALTFHFLESFHSSD